MTQAPPARRADVAKTSLARRTSMRDALHAEWAKARTLPGTTWLLLAAVALTALLSLGIAAAVRDGAAAIGIVLGLLYLFPILGQVVGGGTAHRHLEQLAPMTAGLAIQATTGLRSLPISPWAGLGVLAGWAAAALLAGGTLLRLRDA